MWTVYVNPKDFPGKVVVRAWSFREGTKALHKPEPDAEPLYVGDSLEEARAAIEQAHPGAYRLNRDPNDEPHIREVWL